MADHILLTARSVVPRAHGDSAVADHFVRTVDLRGTDSDFPPPVPRVPNTTPAGQKNKDVIPSSFKSADLLQYLTDPSLASKLYSPQSTAGLNGSAMETSPKSPMRVQDMSSNALSSPPCLEMERINPDDNGATASDLSRSFVRRRSSSRVPRQSPSLDRVRTVSEGDARRSKNHDGNDNSYDIGWFSQVDQDDDDGWQNQAHLPTLNMTMEISTIMEPTSSVEDTTHISATLGSSQAAAVSPSYMSAWSNLPSCSVIDKTTDSRKRSRLQASMNLSSDLSSALDAAYPVAQSTTLEESSLRISPTGSDRSRQRRPLRRVPTFSVKKASSKKPCRR